MQCLGVNRRQGRPVASQYGNLQRDHLETLETRPVTLRLAAGARPRPVCENYIANDAARGYAPRAPPILC